MTTTVHKDLTGADLHEPKGADTALSGQVYVSDGVGSGTWTAASSVITNTAWSTGDLKATHKVTADSGWVMWSDGSIGDGSSSATIRANADCSDLFALYWNNYSDTLCPVSGGRGVSAAADFAAHKRISVPAAAGRAFGLAGSGSGLTSRTVGYTTGAETYTLLQANLPAIKPAITITDPGHKHGTDASLPSNSMASGSLQALTGLGSGNTQTAFTGITAAFTNNLGSGAAFTIMQPTAFINVMIKL